MQRDACLWWKVWPSTLLHGNQQCNLPFLISMCHLCCPNLFIYLFVGGKEGNASCTVALIDQCHVWDSRRCASGSITHWTTCRLTYPLKPFFASDLQLHPSYVKSPDRPVLCVLCLCKIFPCPDIWCIFRLIACFVSITSRHFSCLFWLSFILVLCLHCICVLATGLWVMCLCTFEPEFGWWGMANLRLWACHRDTNRPHMWVMKMLCCFIQGGAASHCSAQSFYSYVWGSVWVLHL